jgi:sulfite exporter TauE/SafE
MLPVQQASPQKKIFLILSYHGGRILTYSVLGLLIGLVGRTSYLAGYQRWFSIGAGALALVMAVLYFFLQKGFESRLFGRYYTSIRQLIVRALQKAGTVPGSLMLGAANGLLPCGMVYMAILAAVSFTTIQESVLFMALFGAGTLPMMFATTWAGQQLKWRNRLSIQRLIPVFILITGCLLVFRGLNLGIPFLSPHIASPHEGMATCEP